MQIDYRWGGGDIDKTRKHATELAASALDVIFVTGSPAVEQLLKATRAVPIVFAFTPDPVGAGLVESLSQPGGNATGFLQFEYAICLSSSSHFPSARHPAAQQSKMCYFFCFGSTGGTEQ